MEGDIGHGGGQKGRGERQPFEAQLETALEAGFNMGFLDHALWDVYYGTVDPEEQRRGWTRQKLERYSHQGILVEEGKEKFADHLVIHIKVNLKDIIKGRVGKPICFNDHSEQVRNNIAVNIYDHEIKMDGSYAGFRMTESIALRVTDRVRILERYFAAAICPGVAFENAKAKRWALRRMVDKYLTDARVMTNPERRNCGEAELREELDRRMPYL
jgi:hypothetical protein